MRVLWPIIQNSFVSFWPVWLRLWNDTLTSFFFCSSNWSTLLIVTCSMHYTTNGWQCVYAFLSLSFCAFFLDSSLFWLDRRVCLICCCSSHHNFRELCLCDGVCICGYLLASLASRSSHMLSYFRSRHTNTNIFIA